MSKTYATKRVNRNREIVKAMLPAPCTKCRGLVTQEMNWHADHILSRAEGEALGMSPLEIDASWNLGPAHRSCNTKAGGKLGAQMKAGKKKQVTVPQFEVIERPQPFKVCEN